MIRQVRDIKLDVSISVMIISEIYTKNYYTYYKYKAHGCRFESCPNHIHIYFFFILNLIIFFKINLDARAHIHFNFNCVPFKKNEQNN